MASHFPEHWLIFTGSNCTVVKGITSSCLVHETCLSNKTNYIDGIPKKDGKLPLGCAGSEVPLRKSVVARKCNNLNINIAVHTIHYHYYLFKKKITHPLWPFQMNPV